MKANGFSFAVLVIFAAFLSGCGGDERSEAIRKLNGTNGKRLANLYEAFQHSNSFRGPKDEEELREYIGAMTPDKLELVGIVDPSNLDELFISERDQQPFEIRYRVRGAFTASDPVVFEKEGLDGTRIVYFTGLGEQSVQSDAEYDELWKSKSISEPIERTPMQPVGPNETVNPL